MTKPSNKTGSPRWQPFALALLSGVVLPQFATAQEAAEAKTDERRTLDAIVVTAERREQNLQDVPIAATVLSGDDLAKRSVTDVNAIQQVAPSVAINTYNRSVFINIRGVGIAQSAPTSNPGVAYYIDGTLIPHEQFIRQSFFDIGSIEVLRGPQGTLTGQNSTGGAIYVRSPDPEFGEYSGKLDMTLAQYDKQRAMAAVNLGFSENLAMRVAYVTDRQDSFTDNIGGDSQPGNLDLSSLRANLAFRTSDDKFRFNLRGEAFDYQTDNNAVKNRNDPNPDPFTISEDGRSYLDQQGYRVSAEGRYAFNDSIEARLLLSTQDGWTKDQTDGDRSSTALPVPAGLPASGANRAIYPGRVSNARTDFETNIAEFNLLSTNDGPVQWVVGAFYMDDNVPVELFRDNYSTLDFVSSNSDIVAEAANTSASVFGQINWFLNDNLEVLGGLRYSSDKQEYTRFALPGPPRTFPITTDTQSDEVTGKVGVNYHTNAGALLYATISKGYKAGGVNLEPALGNFGPETNIVYETGFKTEIMDQRLRLNGDVYYSDYSDIQLASLQNRLPITQNAASGEAYGAELEMMGQFGDLNFSLGVGWLNASFSGDACINDTNNAGTDAACPTGNRQVPDGRTLPFSPELTVNAGIEYAFVLDGGSIITPRLQWSNISEQYATPFPSDLSYVGSRDVVDARVTFELNEDLKFEVFANNILDETYVAAQIQNSSSANGGLIYGAPRQVGIRTVINFN